MSISFLSHKVNLYHKLLIVIFCPIGASVLYLLFLAFALFQTREDFRKILFFFDPKLKQAGPDTEVGNENESSKMAKDV